MHDLGTLITENFIAVIVSTVGAALAGYLVKKIGDVLKSIEMKYNLDIDDKLEAKVQDVVRQVVLAITQTYVDGLKKQGKFDEKAKKEALEMAVKKSGQILMEEFGIVKPTEVLTTAIEAQLGEQKEVLKVVGFANESKRRIKKKR